MDKLNRIYTYKIPINPDFCFSSYYTVIPINPDLFWGGGASLGGYMIYP